MNRRLYDIIHFPITGGLNSDDDIRNMPRGDLIDLVNAKWDFNHEQKSGSIENIIGNLLVDINLPDGENKIINGCESKSFNSYYYFVYNSNENHSLIRYNYDSKTLNPIYYSEPLLNFRLDYPINNPFVIDDGNEGIIYWTDDYNRPRKSNIERARKYTNIKYEDGIGYWIIESDFIVQ